MEVKYGETQILRLTLNRPSPGLIPTMLAGLAIIVWGYFVIKPTFVPDGYVATTGTVTHASETCDKPSTVEFQANGRQYQFMGIFCRMITGGSNYGTRGIQVSDGQEVDVIYSPNYPAATAKTRSDVLPDKPFGLSLIVFGAFLFVAALGFRIALKRKLAKTLP